MSGTPWYATNQLIGIIGQVRDLLQNPMPDDINVAAEAVSRSEGYLPPMKLFDVVNNLYQTVADALTLLSNDETILPLKNVSVYLRQKSAIKRLGNFLGEFINLYKKLDTGEDCGEAAPITTTDPLAMRLDNILYSVKREFTCLKHLEVLGIDEIKARQKKE